MELPEVGVHCADPACKQLNFLPLKCTCGKCFCSDHFRLHVDQCTAKPDMHEKELKKIENVYRCSFPNCNTTSIVPLICENCKQHFCIPHRHVSCDLSSTSKTEKEKIANSVRRFNEAKLIVDKQLDANISQARKKGKTSELANKIQFMRLKNKALGLKSIPTEERVYFTIQFLCEGSIKSLPLFVSKMWTVGKVIDVFAQQFKIQNNNNQSRALKLRLFREADGSVISQHTSDRLENLLKDNALSDGETLRFTFVRDDCMFLETNK